MKKGNKLYSIIKLKCPRCHEGPLFVNDNPYQFKGFFDMPERCEVCGQRFELETGFYYGAMYVNYALTIALSIGLYVGIEIFTDMDWVNFLILDIIIMLLLSPYLFKLGRAVWANFFIHYKVAADRK